MIYFNSFQEGEYFLTSNAVEKCLKITRILKCLFSMGESITFNQNMFDSLTGNYDYGLHPMVNRVVG